jgi:hypothetical protein
MVFNHESCSDAFQHKYSRVDWVVWIAPYVDPPYELGIAEWDTEALTEDELFSLLRGFVHLRKHQALVSVVMWCNPFELALVQKVVVDLNFKHIQVLTWYKSGFNQVTGPACTFLPATEMAIIGFQGNPTTAAQYINMPADPLQRHNIIIGPTMGKRDVVSHENEINPSEKPMYAAEWILRKLTKPGDTVIVAGFGAGGDLRGALNAGCNGFGIEKDLRQFNAVKTCAWWSNHQ